MKTSLLKLLVVALTLGVGGLMAQDAPARPDAVKRPLKPTQLHIPRGAELPTAVQDLVDRFKAESASLRESREALKTKLEGLSDAERKAAIEAAREASKDAVRAQRDLARQLRKQLRDLRGDRATGSGG